MPSRIIVVDDDRQIVRLLRAYLEQAGMNVLTAYDGETAMHMIHSERPDLVVLDLGLPGRDGWDITRRLRADERTAGLPILMLTARVEDDDKLMGLELGADDYVTKPFNPPEVVARVRAILRRTAGLPRPPAVLQVCDLRLDLDAHTAVWNSVPLDLTPTEFAILRTLMQNPGRALTRSELIEGALGWAYDGLERTVDSHIKNLRKKIEAAVRKTVAPTGAAAEAAGIIETVFGVGYRLRGD